MNVSAPGRVRRATATLTLASTVLVTFAAFMTPASARTAERPAEVERMHRIGSAPFDTATALVRTTQGVSIAAWPTGSRAYQARDTLVVALRRPHRGWTAAHRVGATPGVDNPVLVPLPRGRAVLAWTTMKGTVATRLWLPAQGWQKTHVLSGRSGQVPMLASDVAARTWVVGAVQPGDGDSQPALVLEVHHGGAVHDVALTSTCVPAPSSIAVDDNGVTATSGSYNCSDTTPRRWAATVPADGGPPVIEQLTACGPDACVLGLDIRRTPGGFTAFGTVDPPSGRTTATWHVDGSGHWTMEPKTHPFIRNPFNSTGVAVSHAGALVACISRAHGRIEVRRPGGAWHAVRIPDVRINGCAVNDHGLVALIGLRRVKHHPLVVVWGSIRSSAITHVIRLAPQHAHYGFYPRPTLSERGQLAALVETSDSRGQREFGLSAVRAQL